MRIPVIILTAEYPAARQLTASGVVCTRSGGLAIAEIYRLGLKLSDVLTGQGPG